MLLLIFLPEITPKNEVPLESQFFFRLFIDALSRRNEIKMMANFAVTILRAGGMGSAALTIKERPESKRSPTCDRSRLAVLLKMGGNALRIIESLRGQGGHGEMSGEVEAIALED